MNVRAWLPRGLLALSLATAPLLAQAGGPGEGRHGGGRMGFLKELDLTEQQREQLKALRQEGKGDFQQRRETLKKLREDFHALLASESASEAQIRAAFVKLQEQRQAIALGAIDKMLAVRKILTPEQRKKAQALREKHKGKMGKHRGGPGGEGPEEDDDF